MKALLNQKDKLQPLITGFALIVLIIVFSSISEFFLSPANLLSILLTATSVGLIAVGQFLCLVSRDFDMAVGNVAAMGGVIFTMLVKDSGWGVPMAAITALVFGFASGFITGFCVAKLKTPAFITTFSLLQIYRGILFVLTSGMPISMPTNPAYRFLGSYKLFDVIQLPILFLILAFVLFHFIMRYTKLGRNIFAIGSNPDAAHICGVNVVRTRIFCFVVVGVLAAFAGVLFASRVNSAQPNVGATYAMDSIAACVVGGTAMSGGKGSMIGAFVGVVIVNLVQNGLVMIGMDASYQYIATGLILFIAVLAQTNRKK